MGPTIDYNALRAQTLGSGNDEEAVTVNTRALIDKVLARYSGEWTVLRELLQNAADATATKVTIRLETSPSSTVPAPTSNDASTSLKHICQHHTLRRLLVTNNGHPFGASDWSRLKRIAEGNPDETKIGAFGVGFYSVFADCEEPFVSSGNEAMAFYWKGNSLFTRRLQLQTSQASLDTTFVLEYRSKTSPVPGLLPLCQFLATSLTFVGVQEIELWLDEWNILRLAKKAAPNASVELPKEVDTKTREGVMKVTAVDREVVQMDAHWMQIVTWRRPTSSHQLFSSIGGSDFASTINSGSSIRNFFSRLAAPPPHSTARHASQDDIKKVQPEADLASISNATVFLQINTAQVRTSVTASFGQELERATKKPAPKHLTLAILTSSRHDSTASNLRSNVHGDDGNIFASVLPVKAGKIFIGFPTHQTTGLLAHISAHSVIPTVERESIDLNARYVRTWNIELLRAAGIVTRIVWSSELAEVKDALARASQADGRMKIHKEDIDSVLPTAIHTFKQFTFEESTPSSQVGQIVEEAFWTSNKNASIEIFSSQGVLPSYKVRLASEDLSGFVEGIPVVPKQLVEDAKDFVTKIKEYGLVTQITFEDVKKELAAKSLNEKQLGEFLKWSGKKALQGEFDGGSIRSLLDAAVATIENDGVQGDVLVLGEVQFFINPSRIPADMPTPPDTIPFKFTRNVPKAELEVMGWEELQIVPWLRFLMENRRGSLQHDLTRTPTFAGQVLPILSKQWDSLSQSSKQTVVNLLEERTVIPTRLGMRKPKEAYFTSVKLFQDLPIISGLQNTKDKFLLALGVRRTVELGVVFERLMTESSPNDASVRGEEKWSHVDLIKYLASVRDDIPPEDIKRLRDRAICPAEAEHNSHKGTTQHYKVSELYEPRDEFRNLRLPVLQWPGVYRPGSNEGRFLTSMLGLKTIPSVPELINIMAEVPADGNHVLRDRALTYFIANHHSNGYAKYPMLSGISQPYLPLQDLPGKLVAPADCFTDEHAAALGFSILRKDLHAHALKFGVQANPPMVECVRRLLRKPPRTRREAVTVFGYFANRLHEIQSSSVDVLGPAAIIPVPANETQSDGSLVDIRHISPRTCFLGDSSTYGEIFDFVDFGQNANTFLLKCGSKHEPSIREIARLVVGEPARILDTVNSTDKYIGLLKTLANGFSSLKADKVLIKEMKKAPFLLATKEVLGKSSSVKRSSIDKKSLITVDDADEDIDDDGPGLKEWSLASASQIVLLDDMILYNFFKQHLLAAPQDEALEMFYSILGSPSLGDIVEEEPRIHGAVPDQRSAVKLSKLIIERSKLFIHDQNTDAIRHDSRWLEKNLHVQSVRSISVRRSLRGQTVSHTEARTAAVTQDRRLGSVLSVTNEGYDMFQVSQALIHFLLKRPKPHSTMFLEMLLSTGLLKLRSRGYNVDRILRAKAAEARLVEDQRQKQLAEERKKIGERERALAAKQVSRTSTDKQSNELTVPGAFAGSPDRPTEQRALDTPHQSKRPRGLFSNLTKRLGFDETGQSSQQLQNMLGNSSSPKVPTTTTTETPPPPYTPQDTKTVAGNDPSPVTAPHDLHRSLLSAVSASRPHDASTIFSRPSTTNVSEPPTYCDERPGQNIAFAATSSTPSGDMKIFLSHALMSDKSGYLTAHSSSFDAFARLLAECATIFALPPGTLHIFADPNSKTIAFNHQGSLFCNAVVFNQVHWPAFREANPGTASGEYKTQALVYWWVVLCHELAHNLVEDHSAAHSYWTESFVGQYFSNVMLKVISYSTPTNREE
ncbi:MAG: hypothetical protein M1833_001383 [Piccolia ochrophora]|nr:MAG: hypothetical protein M1833_001383 [Piccolia ochrophora]